MGVAFGEFALGQTLGSQAEVRLQGDGGVALAAGVVIAAALVALLLLVAVYHGVGALGGLDLAKLGEFRGLGVVGADGVLGTAGAVVAVINRRHRRVVKPAALCRDKGILRLVPFASLRVLAQDDTLGEGDLRRDGEVEVAGRPYSAARSMNPTLSPTSGDKGAAPREAGSAE